jgi:hypothetical protein
MTSDNPPPGYPNYPPPENQPPGNQNYPPSGNQSPGYQNYPPQPPGQPEGQPFGQPQAQPFGQPQAQPFGPPQGPSQGPPPGYQNYPPQQENLPPGYQPYQPPPQQQPHSNRGKLIASVAAVVVLAGGGTATYLALSSSGSSGAGSPTAAVQRVVGDLQQSDLIGVLDDLAPGERTALSGAAQSDIDSLKRLGVLSPDANGNSISGISIKTNAITYGKPVTINDHVQVVPITGGSVDVSADAAKLPFTQKILSLMTGQPRVNQHVQIPLGTRIAAEKVGDSWYTSIFYTIADTAAKHTVPSPADAIPARGAATPEDAVLSFVRAAMNRDYRGLIGLISPDELGALHDYGGMLGRSVSVVPSMGSSGVTLKTLQLNRTDISGGVRLTPSKIVISKDGQELTITHQGNCFAVSAKGHQKSYCAADLIDQIAGAIPSVTCIASGSVSSIPGSPHHSSSSCTGQHHNFTPEQKTALTHLVSGLFGLGVDTAESGGKWYITPIRTYADMTSTVLGALQGNDLFALASLSL